MNKILHFWDGCTDLVLGFLLLIGFSIIAGVIDKIILDIKEEKNNEHTEDSES